MQRRERIEAHALAERLELSASAGGVGLFEHDHSTGIIRVNRMFREIFELPEDHYPQVSVQDMLSRVPEEEQETRRALVMQAGHSERDESRIVFPNGRKKFLVFSYSSEEVDGYGIITRGAVKDFTEPRKQQETLKILLDRLEQASRIAQVALFDFDINAGSVWVNQALREFLDLPEKDFPSITPELLLSRHDPNELPWVRQALMRAISGSIQEEYAWKYVLSDGSRRWARIILKRVRNEDGSYRLTGAMTDITESHLKQTELDKMFRALEQRTQEAEEARDAQARFLATMTHELRTPLNAVLGFGDLIERSGQLRGEAAQHISSLNLAGRELLSVINDILDASKMEAGEFKLETEPFSIKSALDDVIEVMSIQAKIKQLELNCPGLPEGCPEYYSGDVVRIKQILFNLVGNAIKFTKSGSVSVTLQDKGVDENGRQRLRLDVVDTGVGVSAENAQRLFSRFYQVEEGNKRTHGGTGLGLSIVRELADKMHGFAEVNSEPGVGSTFSVQIALPALTREDFLQHRMSERLAMLPGDEYLRLDGVRVLLVDDSSVNLKVARRSVEREGAVVVGTAENGVEAVAWVESPDNIADVVLMDVQMPEMDGLEATARICRLSAVPIIGLSAGIDHDDQALAVGMNDFLHKPLNLTEVLVAIRTQVSIARGQELAPGRLKAEAGGEGSAVIDSVEDKHVFDPAIIQQRLGTRREYFLKNLNSMLQTYARYTKVQMAPRGERERDAMRASLRALMAGARLVEARQLEEAAALADQSIRSGNNDTLMTALQQVELTLTALLQALVATDNQAED